MRRRPILSTCLALWLSGPAPAAPAGDGRIEDRNIAVTWHYRALSDAAGDQGLGTLDVTVEDLTTHQPLRYPPGRLAAWLQPPRNALSDGEPSCGDKVRMLATQGLGRRADIDLNGWRLLTFNTDRTLAFINPFVGLNNAKLESIVTLPGDIDNWASIPERLQLWVHSRDGEQGRLSLVDTHRRRIARNIDTPAGPAALVADGTGLWVVSPQAHRLGRLDTGRPDAKPPSATAPNIVNGVAAPGGGLYAWHGGSEPAIRLWQVANSGEPRAQRLWSLPAPPVAARWSEQAQRLIVALDNGHLAWIDPQDTVARPERVQAAGPPGTRLSAIALFDDGRRLLWLDGRAATAGAVDVASGRELAATAVVADADSLAITGDFAYVHSTAGAKATLLSLADIRSGRAQAVDITTGRPSAAALPGIRVVPEPTGHGVLIANPADGVVYQYAEGMMAPAGSFSNYRRSALGLMVLDTSLTEVGPGHYRAAIRHHKGGPHELLIGGTNPTLVACAAVNLPKPADETASGDPSPRISAVLQRIEKPQGGPELSRSVQVRLSQRQADGTSLALSGVDDLTLLVFDRRSAWQHRVRLQETESGIYAAAITLPRPGRFDWLVSSPSQNLPFHAAHLGSHDVGRP